MFDPAALGTLRIGLDAIEAEATAEARAEPRRDRRNRSIAAPRRARLGFRLTLARALRRAASMLDTPTIGEVVQ